VLFHVVESNQILFDIRGGKESKSRFIHSIIKSFNQHCQIKRDTLQSSKNIQHSKLFIQSVVNPNSSSSNQEKEGNKKLIKIEWIETNQISFSDLISPPQIPFHSFKIFISHPPPLTLHSSNLPLKRFKVFCMGFNHQMIVSDVHQIKSFQTFKSLISFFVEDELFSTDELQDEIVNGEENHSRNCEKDELFYFELGCYFPSFKLSGIGQHLIQITSTTSKDALQSSSSSILPSSCSFISTSFFHPISNYNVINISHSHQSSV